MAYVFYESGLAVNVMYGLAEGGKRRFARVVYRAS